MNKVTGFISGLTFPCLCSHYKIRNYAASPIKLTSLKMVIISVSLPNPILLGAGASAQALDYLLGAPASTTFNFIRIV